MQWLLSFAFELFLVNGIVFNGKMKRLFVWFFMIYVIGVSALAVADTPSLTVPILSLLPFRLFNLARVAKERMHHNYLRRMTLRTSGWLMIFQVISVLLTMPYVSWAWPLMPYVLLLLSLVLLCLLIYHLRKTRHIANVIHYSDKELPTVSVCIPARNETESLEECLRTITANDYPKLEILVLDDCSQDRTAEVIKSFAHDGVRFIRGDEPEPRWLAKNQAYNKLAREATGDLILFCGVDVRLGSTAIRALVTTLLNRNKSMISVMPLRFYSRLSEAFVQPMRYWWELIPPRKFLKRPAVLSTCWLVDRKKLKKAGGFSAVSHAIIPEGYFARHFIKSDGYTFIRADEELDVRTTKPFAEQWATAVRTNYPQIRRRPEVALLLTLFTLGVLVMPFILLPLAILSLNYSLAILLSFTCIFLTITHVLVLQYSDPGNVPIAFISLPLAALSEVVIGYVSMFKYEFGSVDWKDRNVCIPVMHVVPHLPSLDKPKSKVQSPNFK